MANDGMRVVIERREKELHWTLTQHGNQHTGQVRSSQFSEAGAAVDQYIRALGFKRHFDKQREQNKNAKPQDVVM